MKRIVLFAFLFCGVQVAFCQCFTCTRDFADCQAFIASHQCGSKDTCFCTIKVQASLDRLVPGFLAGQEGGRLVITHVLPGTGADTLGLRIGDQIIEINGKRAGELSCRDGWDNGTGYTKLLVQRDNQFSVNVPLTTLRNVVEQAWTHGQTGPTQVSLKTSEPSNSLMLFTFGIRSVVQDRAMRVTAVLDGSPAFEAGLVPGMILLAIDGIRTSEALSGLADSIDPRSVDLLVSDDGRVRMVNLKSKPLSRIIRTFNSQKRRDEYGIASAIQ